MARCLNVALAALTWLLLLPVLAVAAVMIAPWYWLRDDDRPDKLTGETPYPWYRSLN